jgi:hypothetical protein
MNANGQTKTDSSVDPAPKSDIPATPPARKGPETGATVAIPRNAPCPCGSGRKFKHCHGVIAEATAHKVGAAPNSDLSSTPAPASLPPGVKGWSWGAFLLSAVWAVRNRVWIGVLALVPVAGFVFAIVLGVKGREWAWKAKPWESVTTFNAVQRKWSVYGGVLFALFATMAVISF